MTHAEATNAALIPDQLGDFRIIREIGRGGMGVVYEAQQLSLKRRVALKVLPFAAVMDPRQLKRFQNEAEAAASLHHTSIVPVHAVGSERGVHFYAMQFIEGRALDAVIQDLRRHKRPREALHEQGQGALNDATTAYSAAPAVPSPVPPTAVETTAPAEPTLSTDTSITGGEFFRTVARLGIQAAEALDHAHQQGIIHRDIKPANLLLDVRGNLWITDFGLARFQNETNLSMSGDLIGTLRYMSPEQALAKRVVVDHRTDIYSLGVTLFELLTLEPQFAGNDRQELLRQIAFDEPRPPRRVNKSVPAELDTIVTKAMEKNPIDRYATAQDLADDLRRFLEDRPIAARRPSAGQRLAKWARRHRALVWAGVIVLALTTVISSVAALSIRGQMERTRAERLRAEQNLDTAYQVLDELYQNAKRLAGRKEMTDEDKKGLERMLSFYQQIANGNSREPAPRLKMALAFRRASDIQFTLGEYVAADKANERSVLVLEELVEEFPDNTDYRRALVSGHLNWGHALLLSGRLKEAEQAYRRVEEFGKKLLERSPDDWFGKSLVATGNLNGGNIPVLLGHMNEAERAYRTAIRLHQELSAAYPREQKYLNSLRIDLGNLYDVLVDGQRLEEVEQTVDELARLLQRFKQDFPETSADPLHQVDIHMGRGLVFRLKRRLSEAEEHFRHALTAMEPLLAKLPNSADFGPRLAELHLQQGLILQARGKLQEAEASLRRAIPPVAALINKSPLPSYSSQLGTIHVHLGKLLQASGRGQERRARSPGTTARDPGAIAQGAAAPGRSAGPPRRRPARESEAPHLSTTPGPSLARHQPGPVPAGTMAPSHRRARKEDAARRRRRLRLLSAGYGVLATRGPGAGTRVVRQGGDVVEPTPDGTRNRHQRAPPPQRRSLDASRDHGPADAEGQKVASGRQVTSKSSAQGRKDES